MREWRETTEQSMRLVYREFRLELTPNARVVVTVGLGSPFLSVHVPFGERMPPDFDRERLLQLLAEETRKALRAIKEELKESSQQVSFPPEVDPVAALER